ncbi:MAG: ChaN family lipoprotein [Bdellovibrionaceae bacterium]|jgi:uncharacterized iron-regulated protein|nr:ChaN family lipoprotein [Pseudobdellovibrionaceae bacterium]
MKLVLFLSVLVLSWNVASAYPKFEGDKLYKDGRQVSMKRVIQDVKPGTVIILSELHTWQSHHDHQLEFLNTMRAKRPDLKINVGMEFFEYSKQNIVDDYLNLKMDEVDFLKQIGWGENDYNQYRPLVTFPQVSLGETTLALNASRKLSSKIAKNGWDSLNDKDRNMLPPNFSLGRDIYYERFKESMSHGHKLPEELVLNYFGAQSLWDDTMAWTTVEFMKEHPEDILVIIVGDFHNIFGGGLPHRIKARGHENVLTISQLAIDGLTEQELYDEAVNHPKWGARADYVWTSYDGLDKEEAQAMNFGQNLYSLDALFVN